MTARDTEIFLDAVFETHGVAAVAFGHDGHRAGQSYRHRDFRQRFYPWPDGRATLLADVSAAAAGRTDVYVCPALRRGHQRRQGDAAAPTVAWVDLDHAPTDEQTTLIDKLDGLVVASGTEGHLHVYVRLLEPVDVDTLRRLNEALRDALGGDTKSSDESLLRLPGTGNHKSTPPDAVTLEHIGERRWDPDELAGRLGVDLSAPRPQRPDQRHDGGVPVGEPAPDPLPEPVMDALARTAADYPEHKRSGAHHALVWACRTAGLTLAQTVTVAEDYGPSVEKFGGRRDGVAGAVAGSWAKVRPSEAETMAALGFDVAELDARTAHASTNGHRPPAGTEHGRTGTLPTLPETFWAVRPSLGHIRAAAHAQGVGADQALHGVLARIAALAHHRVRVDTGILSPASLNVFVATVSPSGRGKTSGNRVARGLVPVPGHLATGDAFRDGLPLGSGEGLAEQYMGTVTVPTGETIKSGPNKGQPKMQTVRRQARHHALVSVDEGQGLLRMMLERSGATVGPTLRSGWSGEVLGQANAREENTRIIERGTYALGMVVGFQPDTIGPLFGDAAGGTPQRFLYCATVDPSIPDDPPEWPGPLTGLALDGPAPAPPPAPEPAMSGPQLPSKPPDPDAGERIMRVTDAEVRRRVRAEHLAVHRGQASDEDPLDAHRPLHLAKVSALLAVLDGRTEVTGEDWALAEQVWATSVAVRTALVEHGRAVERDRVEARTAAHVDREERAAVARGQVDTKVDRIARRLAERVHEEGETSRSTLRNQRLAHRDRGLFEAAVERAATAGWVTAGETRVSPGAERPS